MKKELRGLINIARVLSNRPDLVQGAGGNLSVKLDAKRMRIKASGFMFDELSEKHGFVTVDYTKLRARYARVKKFDEKKESAFLVSCAEGVGARPSMEAGFHAFLGRYVLHTHPVYTNVLVCAKGGESIALGIAKHIGIHAAYLPYANPGPELAAAISVLIKKNKKIPSVIFLGNHGLIVSGNTADEVLKLHEKINNEMRDLLQLAKYPRVGIKAEGKNFRSKYLQGMSVAALKKTVLFPDQAVFCADAKKIVIKNGEVVYHTHEKEARVLEELLHAWSYIVRSITKLNMKPLTLSTSVVRYLTNMEAEKHRKNAIR